MKIATKLAIQSIPNLFLFFVFRHKVSGVRFQVSAPPMAAVATSLIKKKNFRKVTYVRVENVFVNPATICWVEAGASFTSVFPSWSLGTG